MIITDKIVSTKILPGIYVAVDSVLEELLVLNVIGDDLILPNYKRKVEEFLSQNTSPSEPGDVICLWNNGNIETLDIFKANDIQLIEM